LLRLPDAVFQHQLLPFFCLGELAQLDRAITHRHARTVWFRKLSGCVLPSATGREGAGGECCACAGDADGAGAGVGVCREESGCLCVLQDRSKLPCLQEDCALLNWLLARKASLGRLRVGLQEDALELLLDTRLLRPVLSLSLESAHLSAPALLGAVAACWALRALSLADNSVTDVLLDALPGNCTQLRALSLARGCLSDAAVTRNAPHCPWLQAVDLSACQGLGDAAVKALSLHCPLRTLRLARCSALGDAGVEALAANLGLRLQHLDVSFCQRLTDRSLLALGTHCPQLRVLELNSCKSLGTAGLAALAGCAHLRYLDLSCLWALQDDTLTLLAACPLSTLLLFRCGRLTDASVSNLRCPLQHLSLRACKLLTDASLQSLPDSLCSLNLTSCRVSDAAVGRLVEALPGCEVTRDPVLAGAITDHSLSGQTGNPHTAHPTPTSASAP